MRVRSPERRQRPSGKGALSCPQVVSPNPSISSSSGQPWQRWIPDAPAYDSLSERALAAERYLAKRTECREVRARDGGDELLALQKEERKYIEWRQLFRSSGQLSWARPLSDSLFRPWVADRVAVGVAVKR